MTFGKYVLFLLLTALSSWGFGQAALPGNLYEYYNQETRFGMMSPRRVQLLNDQVLRESQLDLSSFEANSSNDSHRMLRITQEKANEILQSSFENLVVSPKFVENYDPFGNIGFCFGRALYFHLELLRLGFDKSSIRKAWMIGPMYSEADKITWQFHVATIVRGNRDWIAFDTDFKTAMPLKQWFEHWQKSSTDGKVRIYITEPQRFGASALRYQKSDLTDEFYNKYFDDMFQQFKELGQQKQQSRICQKVLL